MCKIKLEYYDLNIFNNRVYLQKINWRALLGLTEDIMVEQLNIPRQWATTIDKYLEKNKSD